MSIRATWFRRCRGALLGAALPLLALAGCSRDSSTPTTVSTPAEVPEPETKQAAATAVKVDPGRMRQPFRDAVLLDPPVNDEQIPQDNLTSAGKNIARLYEVVAGKDNQGGLFDQVELVSARGEALKYQAVLTTKLGEIHIELYPAAAPNHVRSFIALARAGYFDGLPIYKSVREID